MIIYFQRAISGLSDSIGVGSELSLVFLLFRVELVIRDVKVAQFWRIGIYIIVYFEKQVAPLNWP